MSVATAVARLTWQTADPVALAADLVARLGDGAEPGPLAGGGLGLDLGSALLEIVAWRPEAEDDAPRLPGRLVFEPLEPYAPPAPAPSPGTAGPASPGGACGPGAFRLAAVGWATVDLERAADELGPWLATEPGTDPAATGSSVAGPARDPHIGARTTVQGSAGLPGDRIVLAEPDTEGRLASVLARDGEGPAVLYLAPAAGLERWRLDAVARGVSVSTVQEGPLGPAVLLLLPAGGPQVVLVDANPSEPEIDGGGTIAS